MSIDGGNPTSITYAAIKRNAGLSTFYLGANATYFAGDATRLALWDRSIAFDIAAGKALANYPYTFAQLT